MTRQFQLYDTYWTNHENYLTNELRNSGDFSQSIELTFTDESDAQLVEPIRRILSMDILVNYTTSDEDMIPVLDGPWTGPVYLTYCVNTTTGDLTGFQVWYEYYDPKVGMCHGDMSTSCTRVQLGYVSQVNIFVDPETETLRGMELEQKDVRNNFYNSYSGETIQAGRIGVNGDLRRNVTWTGDQWRFFGFNTETRYDGKITALSVVQFDQERFARNKIVVDEERNAESLANAQFHGEVAMTLQNRQLMRDSVVASSFANVAGVYRPEQYRIDLATSQRLAREFVED